LDSVVKKYRENKGLSELPRIVDSQPYVEWENGLYDLRNKVVHEGWRLATFENAKKGIAYCKTAIKDIESRIAELSDAIQIYPGVEHLNNTAGTLKF
jgi:hypothetical protein